VIYNIESFVKILPKYFKTRNYSSFVRQLNLYNFHKIKNPDGNIEFGHEKFRRNQMENLQFINRKINQDNDSVRQKLKIQKPISLEYNRLLGIIRNLENSLKAANSKNETTQKQNNELIKELEKMKNESAKKTRKLLFIVWLVSNNFDEELLLEIKTLYLKHGIEMEYHLFDTQEQSKVSMLFEERYFQPMQNSEFLLDQLLILISNFHNSKPKNKYNKVNIENVLMNFDETESIRRINEFSPPRFPVTSSCARSDLYSLENSPDRRLPSVCNFMRNEDSSSLDQLEFESDMKNSRMKSRNTTFEIESLQREEISVEDYFRNETRNSSIFNIN